MTEVLSKHDRISQIKKRIRILKQRPEKSKKELFSARLLADGSIHTRGHIAEGGVDLESLKVRIVPDLAIGYVDERKVADFKGVILKSLEIESFLRVDQRFWRWPFETSATCHGEYHRKVAGNWWRDEAPRIIADILEELEDDIDDVWHSRGEMNTREAQALINRKMPGIILKLKTKFKEQAPIYPLDEPAARKAQLAAGPIHIWGNFQIAALVNIRFGYSTEKIKKIQEIVGTGIDGIYGKKTLEAVRKYQKHLTQLGLYEGPENGLWNGATETAHEKYMVFSIGEEEKAERIDKESLKDIIKKVDLPCQFEKAKTIAAETKWPGIKDSDQRLYLRVKTIPQGYEEKVNLEVGEVRYRPGYRPGPGTLKRKSSSGWIYVPFTEPKTEKHPVLIGVEIVARVGDAQVATLKFSVLAVFDYLIRKNAYDRALEYVRWKYPVPEGNLRSLKYKPGQAVAGLTSWLNNATFGQSAFGTENILASTIGHENVHGGQSWFRRFVEKYAEPEAYRWEIKHMRMTGIDNDHTYIQETREKLEEYRK